MQTISERESPGAYSPKSSTTGSVKIRRKAQSKKRSDISLGGDGVFSLTGIEDHNDEDNDAQANANGGGGGSWDDTGITQPETKPTPFFLTKGETWKRLWRTKADIEHDKLKLAEKQLRETGGAAISGLHRSTSGGAHHFASTNSYASGLLDEEHIGALLCKLRTNEKISVLRHDPEKRKLFSAACNALSVAIKKEGETVILKRRARSAALLRKASHVSSSRPLSPPPENADATSKRASHFLALPLANSSTKLSSSHQHHHSVHYVESADGESSESDPDDEGERDYFAAASRMTQDIEKQRRGHAALERHEMLRCARLIRAAEDIEKVDVMRSKQFTDVQIEVRVNFFATTSILAAHMGSWFGAIAKRHKQQQLQHQQQQQQPQQLSMSITSSSAVDKSSSLRHQVASTRILRLVNGCSALIQLRQDAALKACARAIWGMWLLCRARIRTRRKRLSIALVRRFISHRRDTMKFVVAVNHYLDTVRYMQSVWRGTMMLRSLRHDLAIRQFQLFLTRLIKEDVARVATLKAQCRQKECEIANRKGVPRLVKSQWITELKKETEADIAASQIRARKAEALRERQDTVTLLVELALTKKHHDYHQQVGRYAKALSSYVREINALKSKRIMVVQRRTRRATSSATNNNNKPLQSQSSQRASPKHASFHTPKGGNSSTGTPPPTQRSSSFLDSARRASTSMETARRQTNVQAQIDAFMKGGKIFVEEPSTIRSAPMTSSMSAKGSMRGGGNVSSHNGDVMLWAMLKERGIVGHIPIKPIQPFFHSLFHAGEMVQLLEDAKV